MKTYRIILKLILLFIILFIMFGAYSGYIEIEKAPVVKITNSSIKKNQKDEIFKVIPMGTIVGVYVNTNGILVIDTGEVIDLNGNKKTPAKHKLLPGDYIIGLNGESIKTKKKLITKITESGGKKLTFQIIRNNKKMNISIHPIETEMNLYKVGIWVRDDLQGLGTVTYVRDNQFTGLGHSINDMDTGKKLKIGYGEIYVANMYGIEKGKKNEPGEIQGFISYKTENVVGNIIGNNNYGIYGHINNKFKNMIVDEKPIPIAEAEEVKLGKAYIQSYVSGIKEQYEIKIINIRKNHFGDLEMEILVKDPKLLRLTGGIVQGMSGSPIIQNDKLVGAVTHVLVKDPKKGYGIFIENMLEHENIKKNIR